MVYVLLALSTGFHIHEFSVNPHSAAVISNNVYLKKISSKVYLNRSSQKFLILIYCLIYNYWLVVHGKMEPKH